jgi:glutathione-regulated potassium-efflux system ancillary protein KefG
MPSILLLFAHPRYEKSRANHVLIDAVADLPNVTLHDLYENYPDFHIDIEREKSLLMQHEIVIWHHPLYWYSCPPLLKQWIDIVLEYGWAYGPGGTALTGKTIFNTITSGGIRKMYLPEGRNRFTLPEFLRPFEQTAHLCKMTYLPPFALMGSHRLKTEELEQAGSRYRQLLESLIAGRVAYEAVQRFELLNDWLEQSITKGHG